MDFEAVLVSHGCGDEDVRVVGIVRSRLLARRFLLEELVRRPFAPTGSRRSVCPEFYEFLVDGGDAKNAFTDLPTELRERRHGSRRRRAADDH